MNRKIKVVGVIPAHLRSIRFPEKVILKIYNLTMIELVWRKAKLSKFLDDLYVATNSKIIKKLIERNGGKVILTKKNHRNGTSRVSEAIKLIKCTHAIIIQGDEPLLDPRHLDNLIKSIKIHPFRSCWNFTAKLNNNYELNKKSFVKCAVLNNNKIHYFFRKTPSFSKFKDQKKYIKKVLGVLCFRREILINYNKFKKSVVEEQEFIEQMTIIDNLIDIYSFNVDEATPSINEPGDVRILKKYLRNSKRHLSLSKKIGLNII